MNARLMLGDCLDVMAEIPSGSVRHVVTDPPYGQSNESYDRGVDPRLWRECFRVTGPDAVLLSFAGGPTYHRIASDIEAAGWTVRQMWGWVYRDGFITSAWPKEGFDRLAPAMDPIVYATKGKVILRLEREGEPWNKLKRDGSTRGRGRTCFSDRQSNHGATASGGHWPKAIASDGVGPFEYFALSRTNGGHPAEKHGHPNQKPLALMLWLVGKLPGPGVILDPFAGSGTTLEAARLGGFDAIGIERDPGYFASAEARIAGAASPVGVAS